MPSFRLSEEQRVIYRRYASLALPRHTSYPIAPVWSTTYQASGLKQALRRSSLARRPLSLYVHVPFCEKLCYFCTCTREIVPLAKKRQHDPSDAFLAGLELEVPRFAQLVGGNSVDQVHLGGGSPSYLSTLQLCRLWETLGRDFDLTQASEIAIEVDPRTTTREHLFTLRGLGFNRISLGVQDFDERVQRAVNRIQPFDMVARTVEWCRELAFDSVNFDLIYGLPFQTLESMGATLDQVVGLAPDRIAFYRFAVIPEIFRWQNVFKEQDLPANDLPLNLNLLAIDSFQKAGYLFIGLDHFARPTEALARAEQEGTLRRTFQGMTTGRGLDVLAFGPSGITQLEDAFAQNVKTSLDWEQAVVSDFATERGMDLSPDDRLRRDLLQQLYGHGVIDKRALEAVHDIEFDQYFAEDREHFPALLADELIVEDDSHVELTVPLGRLLVRVVAAVFDRYLPKESFRQGLPAHLSSRVG